MQNLRWSSGTSHPTLPWFSADTRAHDLPPVRHSPTDRPMSRNVNRSNPFGPWVEPHADGGPILANKFSFHSRTRAFGQEIIAQTSIITRTSSQIRKFMPSHTGQTVKAKVPLKVSHSHFWGTLAVPAVWPHLLHLGDLLSHVLCRGPPLQHPRPRGQVLRFFTTTWTGGRGRTPSISLRTKTR